MGFTLIFAAVTITPLAFLARNTLRRVLVSPQKRKWLIVFSVVLIVGAVAGCWLGFVFEYRVSSTLRVVGCPLPLAFFKWEHDHWTDFITPAPLLNGVINVIVITLLALAPLNIIFRSPKQHG